jgi:hypothetical protein
MMRGQPAVAGAACRNQQARASFSLRLVCTAIMGLKIDRAQLAWACSILEIPPSFGPNLPSSCRKNIFVTHGCGQASGRV